MIKKIAKITGMGVILFISGFLLLSFALPGHSYTIGGSLFAAPITATKLITASISQLANNETSFPKTQNILILGIPGRPNNAPYLTDTIIVAQITENDGGSSINTISIPRDLLVENNGFWQKINALYANDRTKFRKEGVSSIKTKIEEITGLKIHKYVIIDLIAVKELVNQVNGINLLVPRDIYDPRFPGPDNSYKTFQIKKGWRYLSGDMALRYVRTRHDAEGDFGRMKRQIQVIRALKNKIFSLNPILNLPTFLKILKTLNSHIKTNLGPFEIVHLWNLSKEINEENIQHIILDTSPDKNLLKGAQMILGGQTASVLIPIRGIENYRGIQEYINGQLTINH